jgi:hypothetical protein
MSHKKSNEELRGQRLAGDLWAALDSAAWQSEEARRQSWTKALRSDRDQPDDFDIAKIIDDQLRS